MVELIELLHLVKDTSAKDRDNLEEEGVAILKVIEILDNHIEVPNAYLVKETTEDLMIKLTKKSQRTRMI